jgi:hypothetical protein
MSNTEQADVLVNQHEDSGENGRTTTLTKQHEARMKQGGEGPLLEQQEKTERKRLSLFVKDYFAEFFLASMSIIGMILSVIYLLAHTWQ